MATLFELKEEILKGRKVKRKDWKNDKYQFLGFYEAYPEDMFADDWELEPFPKVKKKKTMYQFVFYINECKSVYVTSQLYESERDFIFSHSCLKILKIIPHEIEVEE